MLFQILSKIENLAVLDCIPLNEFKDEKLYPGSFKWVQSMSAIKWLQSMSAIKWVQSILFGDILLGSMSFWLLFCNGNCLSDPSGMMTSTLCLAKKSLLYKSRNLNSIPNSIKIFVNSVRFLVRIIVKIQATAAPQMRRSTWGCKWIFFFEVA